MKKCALVYLGHSFRESLEIESVHIVELSNVTEMRWELVSQLEKRGDAHLLTEALLCHSGMSLPMSLDNVFTDTDKTSVLSLEMGYVMLLDITDMGQTGDVVFELCYQDCGITAIRSSEDYDMPEDWSHDHATCFYEEDRDDVLCIAINLLLA